VLLAVATAFCSCAPIWYHARAYMGEWVGGDKSDEIELESEDREKKSQTEREREREREGE
jgi:hypothetical protein